MALRIAKCKRCALFYEKRGFCAHFGPLKSVVAVEHFQFSQPHKNLKVPKVLNVLNVWSLKTINWR